MQTETEQIKQLLQKADNAEAEAKRYKDQAKDLSRELVLPFLRNTSKCRVECSDMDFHDIVVLTNEAWVELLSIFKSIGGPGENVIDLDDSENGNHGYSLNRNNGEPQLYMSTTRTAELGIPLDVSKGLKHLMQRKQHFLKQNAASAEKLKQLPGAYIHEKE